MSEDVATLQTQLSEARAALHQLVIGNKAVDVTIDGKRVSYGKTEVAQLNAYIADLRARIITAGGTCSDGGQRRQARSIYFGN